MPWPSRHKRETHARIVGAAAAAFRARGLDGTGVAEVMDRAGLTPGGFYAHFSSKEHLLAEALEHAGREALASLSGALDALPPEERLVAVLEKYLSADHMNHPDRGCPIAALGPELVRGTPEARRRLARAIRERLAWLRGLLPPTGSGRADEADHAAGALACMVGGVILARGLGGADGRALLRACRAFIDKRLGSSTRRRRRAGGQGASTAPSARRRDGRSRKG